jgi:uncharacterized cupin superfamily protein
VAYRIVDPVALPAERGPHPAASPFDKRVTEHLGLSAFEAYFVALPPGESTVRHDHLDDRVEDLYVIVRGSGELLVDDERVPVGPHQFVAVTLESSRQLLAGTEGLDVVAICSRGPGG